MAAAKGRRDGGYRLLRRSVCRFSRASYWSRVVQLVHLHVLKMNLAKHLASVPGLTACGYDGEHGRGSKGHVGLRDYRLKRCQLRYVDPNPIVCQVKQADTQGGCRRNQHDKRANRQLADDLVCAD